MTISERPAKILEAVQTFFDYVDACGVAEPDGAIVAEGGSGHDCDVRFAQQTIGEILGSESELADIHQHVKRSLRFDRGHVRNLGNCDQTCNCDAYRIPRAYRPSAVDRPSRRRAPPCWEKEEGFAVVWL